MTNNTQEEILRELKKANRGRDQLTGCLFFFILIILSPCILGFFAMAMASV